MVPPQLGGVAAVGGSYLGPEHSGVQLEGDPDNPLPFAFPARCLQGGTGDDFEFVKR